MKSDNIIRDKSFNFAIRIVKLYQYLTNKKETILSKQLLRSGTSVGANVREAENAESKLDFIHKLGIAQKEIDEAIYWLQLLHKTNYLTAKQYNSIYGDAEEIIKIIKSIIISSKKTVKHNY